MTRDEIEKLAKLCRLELTTDQVSALQGDFESILGYIQQLSEVDVTDVEPFYFETNRFRADEKPNETGGHTKDVVADMPKQQDNYLSVQKIL